jgi:NTE family protein
MIKSALVLTGGGARAAYQVGVLKGIAQLLPRGANCPFQVITGTSAGAVNAIALATDPTHFRRTLSGIEDIWANFHVHQIFRTDTGAMLQSGLHLILSLLSGGLLVRSPRSLFDNTPLWELLRQALDFTRIGPTIRDGNLHAIAISATSFTTANSVAFFAGADDIKPWRRASRYGARVELTLAHLIASMSIPFLFRPVELGGEYYGDGAMRQTTPLTPAIHLGADRILVIGVGNPEPTVASVPAKPKEPGFGQMFGFMLDSLFWDGVYSDLDRIRAFNQFGAPRQIEPLVIRPSENLSVMAARHVNELPRSLRVLLRTMGAGNASGTQLLSYLLCEGAFTRELIELGVRDALARATELRAFLGGAAHPSPAC